MKWLTWPPWLDVVATVVCLWAAAFHTPAGVLARSALARATSTAAPRVALVSLYSGGVYQPLEVRPLGGGALQEVLPPPVEPPRQALARGLAQAVSRAPPAVQASARATAASLGLPAPDDDAAAEALLGALKSTLPGDDAAVLGALATPLLATHAVERARASGKAPTLEVLAAFLPGGATSAVGAASQALMLGSAFGLGWPLRGPARMTSPFGERFNPVTGARQLHTGVDLAVPVGTPVLAAAAGWVVRASEDAVNGRLVVVDHGRGVRTAYCHNSVLLVGVGQQVQSGERVASSGNSGRSTGPHLHYQVELAARPVDPLAFVRSPAAPW